ncbi:MAG: hypothetical protein QM528_07205 [Phycisphaerales bacterium]|nr:hypothetical protein [Phycisphaerales bacterium]
MIHCKKAAIRNYNIRVYTNTPVVTLNDLVVIYCNIQSTVETNSYTVVCSDTIYYNQIKYEPGGIIKLGGNGLYTFNYVVSNYTPTKTITFSVQDNSNATPAQGNINLTIAEANYSILAYVANDPYNGYNGLPIHSLVDTSYLQFRITSSGLSQTGYLSNFSLKHGTITTLTYNGISYSGNQTLNLNNGANQIGILFDPSKTDTLDTLLYSVSKPGYTNNSGSYNLNLTAPYIKISSRPAWTSVNTGSSVVDTFSMSAELFLQQYGLVSDSMGLVLLNSPLSSERQYFNVYSALFGNNALTINLSNTEATIKFIIAYPINNAYNPRSGDALNYYFFTNKNKVATKPVQTALQ